MEKLGVLPPRLTGFHSFRSSALQPYKGLQRLIWLCKAREGARNSGGPVLAGAVPAPLRRAEDLTLCR